MGIEVLLIIAGLILEAVAEHGEKLYNLGHLFVTIGVVILIIELIFLALFFIAGFVGLRKL